MAEDDAGEDDLFQFLLGRLKTGLFAVLLVLRLTFQFLLGRLKTWQALATGQVVYSEFQFLLGRLKTQSPHMH